MLVILLPETGSGAPADTRRVTEARHASVESGQAKQAAVLIYIP